MDEGIGRARVRTSIYPRGKKKEVTVHEGKTLALSIENGGCDGLWLEEWRGKRGGTGERKWKYVITRRGTDENVNSRGSPRRGRGQSFLIRVK